MKQPDDSVSLRQMLEYARSAYERAAGRTPEELTTDPDLRDVLARRLEVLGEAANRVSKELKNRHPEVPWLDIVGMRNRLIHAYDQVDLEHMWDTVTTDLPPLITALERILGENA